MLEITPEIIVETSYLGVTLGAINAPHGLILIDSPIKQEDIRSWRSALLNLGGGVDRLLINLDAHPDRTLGVRLMECTVVGHEKMSQAFRNRPTTFKSQTSDTGADWELAPALGTVRWNPPEISFTNQLKIEWGGHQIILEDRSGPSAGAIWVRIPEDKVVFVGDAVVKDQPPFISQADLPLWISHLKELLAPEFREYFFISGRSGLIAHEDVRRQVVFLEKLIPILAGLEHDKQSADHVENILPDLLSHFLFPAERSVQYTQRLRWGLLHYHSRDNRSNILELEE